MSTKSIYFEIRDWMNFLHKKFPNIYVEYAFQKELNFHVIEVSPPYIEQSDDFANEYMIFIRNFYINFPNTNILITEKDEEGINDMTNLLHKVSPKTADLTELEFMESLYVLNEKSNFITVKVTNNNYSIAS